MNKKMVWIGLVLSLFLNLTIITFFGSTIYSESRKMGKRIISDYKTITSDFTYYNGMEFTIEGKFHKEKNYRRLPLKYKDIVRSVVWDISNHSSGISIKFKTNSLKISVKWKLTSFQEHENKSKVCGSGLDLYCLVDNKWQYVRSGIPTAVETEQLFVSKMDTTSKQFLLNLPLYDGIEHIEIGIKKGFNISANSYNDNTKPIVFYGTSITQGASASRPGLAYPSIIGRDLNIETINLGFRGNGKFEKSVGMALCEIDAGMYIIDCTPNSSPEIIKNNALELIKQIRNSKPNVPILIVESIIREYAYFQKLEKNELGGLKYIQAQNNELKKVYNNAIDLNLGDVHYLSSDGLIGHDHEATIDGTHLNDLGMKRIAEKIKQKIIEIYKLQEIISTNTLNE